VAWPTDGLSFGGDYNPEQWHPDVWREDIRLMGEAGVNIVTLGVFSWGLLEPGDGEYDWGWFDEVVGLLSDAGISIDLATPTAAPPSWLLHRHPEILPVDEHLQPSHPGGRLGWCPSSPVFLRYARRIVTAMAERYGRHPAVRLWHVSNELGGGNGRCYCSVSAGRFREWLRTRYESVEAVNTAWNSAFWGHRFGSFDEIEPPRGTRDRANPGVFLDYARFSSGELLAHYDAEAAILKAHSDAPVTTNFMVNAGTHVVDYSTWARHMDIVANDHYTLVGDADRAKELSFSADRMRGLTRGRSPWMLMEHSTGAPAWQQRNRAKAPGEIARNSLAHVARGSDSAMFFQWRASLGGAEQFHSAMLPHAGTNTRVWREIVALGQSLKRLAPVAGSRVEAAAVALLVDEESAWAFEQGLKPHRALTSSREPRLWHAAFWNRQVLVDVLPADASLDRYRVVIIPSLYIANQDRVDRITEFVAAGGTVLVTYLSGIVDETNAVLPGGYPGAFRDLLGVWSEEFRPLQLGESVRLDDGSRVADWTEDTILGDAEPVIRYVDGDAAGRAAVTRRGSGKGAAWYVSTALESGSAQRIVDRLIDELTLPRTVAAPAGVEAVRRCTDTGDVLFLINHTADDAEIAVAGTDLLTGQDTGPSTLVPAGQVVAVKEAARA
jgi:beta-galactosidase